jgi:predicted amidohydrolase
MSNRVIAACIQTNATSEIATNLERLEPMIRTARERGAEFITVPENVNLLVCGRERLFARVFNEADDPTLQFFKRMAQKTGAWFLVGSIAMNVGHERLANRSYILNPKGEAVAHYDKIHMFDATLSEKESYRESNNYRSGDRAVIAQTPWGKVGLTICYDLRFPHLHRALAKAGASIITVPAAFAATTGKLHWHVLLRARAIETGCYIVAPAQCGTHDGGRMTYGHSMIVAPSGEIIAEAGDMPTVITAELDMEKVAEARRMLPSLQHDCNFELPVVTE